MVGRGEGGEIISCLSFRLTDDMYINDSDFLFLFDYKLIYIILEFGCVFLNGCKDTFYQ